MRSSLCSLAILFSMVPNAQAITVQIEVQQWPHCVHPTGSLYAEATGGVGPYTHLWSTGASTPVINDLAAPPASWNNERPHPAQTQLEH